jgi:signal recognition particle subunit SRP54
VDHALLAGDAAYEEHVGDVGTDAVLGEGLRVGGGAVLVEVDAVVDDSDALGRDSVEGLDVVLFTKQPKRVQRVAKGSGRTDHEVGELLQKFTMMKQIMGSIGQQAGMLSRIPGMKQLANMSKLRDAVRTGGLEGNPMMANLADQLLEAAVAGQGGQRGASAKKPVDKNKKKKQRQEQKKARRKGRK